MALLGSYAVEFVGGLVPTQAWGRTGQDRPFYFRARHGDWTLHVGEKGWPTDLVAWPEDGTLIARGYDPTGGCMDEFEVQQILDAWLGRRADA